MTPEVGKMYVTEGGYKAVCTVDFLQKLGRMDPMGCRYGGYLLAPEKDKYVWWTEDGTEPRTPEATLKEEYTGEYDPVFQPIVEQFYGVPRALAQYYSRFEDVKQAWGDKTEKCVRIQRIDGAIVSHTVDLK